MTISDMSDHSPEQPPDAAAIDTGPAPMVLDVPHGGELVRLAHLRRSGTSVLLRLAARELPSLLHWGPDLGQLSPEAATGILSALAMPVTDSLLTTQEAVAILPQHSSGWLGRPGLQGSRQGRAWSVAFDSVQHEISVVDAGAGAAPSDPPSGTVRVTSRAADGAGGLGVMTEVQLLPEGVVRVRAAVRNDGNDVYEVTRLEPALAVPGQAGELLDLTGRHANERHPQRRPFDIGSWVREAWGGRPGHDAATLLCAGVPGFAFRSGRVWGVHVAWSGNQVTSAERSVTGWRLLRGGELLLPGEVRLAPGEEYASPWLVGSWGEGLDALSARIHRMVRARPQHPVRPRPVLLNTWEAVYFDHDVDRLLELAEKAAAAGIERFVLDDGWFLNRRNDRSGLGDWEVDPQVWPQGLHPLVDRVRALGMEFGLWFEPEMINLDSKLALAHPEWIFATNHGPGLPSRYQHVLDLGHEDAYEHLLGRISELVAEYDVAFIKWDHNRALVDAGHQPDGVPGVRAHTQATHRLMAELKRRHPGLEIESCAGGGGRIDLAILDVTDRVWVSDCIDAHERQRMVRWTGLILPPELLGTHVGSGVDHTTGRSHQLGFRAGTAIWGHFGVEWDLTRAGESDLTELTNWIALHKELRPLLHSGEVVHADLANPALLLEGVVAQDRADALYRLAVLDHSLIWPPGRVTLPGLDADVTYHVTTVATADVLRRQPQQSRWAVEGVLLSGGFLGEVGVQCPMFHVDELVLIRAQAVPG